MLQIKTIALTILVAAGLFMGAHVCAAETRDIIFPVLGDTRFSNDFGAPRSGGRTHEGNDIMGMKHQPLVAAVDGTVHYVAYPEPYYGYAVFLEDAAGYEYWYLHINNDTYGTDDGNGGGMSAYAPDILRGNPIQRGQLIGWMGDSGNAESTVSHLHFEIHAPDGSIINPFDSLSSALHLGSATVPPPLENEIVPFDRFMGGGSIAYGELNGKFAGEEIIVGAAAGGGPQVRMYAQNGTLLGGFFAFPESFRGGVDVAAGDFNNDGIDEIIAAAGPGGGPQVRIFTADAKVRGQFMAYAPSFRGGVNVAAADLTGDGIAEIITGAGPGGAPHVRVMTHGGAHISQFFPYATTFRGGVTVDAAEATEAAPALIVTGPGIGGGAHVRLFDSKGNHYGQFFPYDSSFRGGVNVAIANMDSGSLEPEVLVAPASRGGPQFRLYSIQGGLIQDYNAYEPWWRGGYQIAGSTDTASVVTTKSSRRTSIRELFSPY
ncbi:MAG: VCBS repeat domain-containing M23 family metallopeptidase [Candidatus Kerfeldbacteria bacterium]|nr:VCBS repeat domain-containing M23 family metallopeptidase [Candidatus Kerfeldbacteria bacterium]